MQKERPGIIGLPFFEQLWMKSCISLNKYCFSWTWTWQQAVGTIHLRRLQQVLCRSLASSSPLPQTHLSTSLGVRSFPILLPALRPHAEQPRIFAQYTGVCWHFMPSCSWPAWSGGAINGANFSQPPILKGRSPISVLSLAPKVAVTFLIVWLRNSEKWTGDTCCFSPALRLFCFWLVRTIGNQT